MVKVEATKGVEDILYEEGQLNPDQLSAIKFEHVNTGKAVEDIISERGYVTPQQLVQARAKLLNIPFHQIGDINIPTSVLDMVPEAVARKYKLMPFSEEGGVLHIAMVDHLDLQVIEFIEKKTGMRIKPYISEESDVQLAIDEQYGKALGAEVSEALEEVGVSATKLEERLEDIEKAEQTIRNAPVARIVGTILEYAVKARASDVHIESSEEKTRVRYRIDGILQERLTLPKKVHESVVSRIKILSNLKIDEKRVPQDGRFKVEVGQLIVDLRVSTMPTIFGEKVVIRLLKGEGSVISLPDLGLRGDSLKRFEEGLRRTIGIILVTGPTGSGKTNTLASAITKINTAKINIVTLEDPVEIRLPGVNQVQINPVAGLTFASGLRSILRQDPDVVMVGEIRDTETAELAIHAALTGHLVFSTLHTNSAAGALPRLLDMGAEPFLLASTVNCVVAQRLVRTLCEKCRKKYEPLKPVIEDFKNVLGNLINLGQNKEGVKKQNDKFYLYKAKGCDDCDRTGYTGRTGIFEVFILSPKVSKMVLERQPASILHNQSVEEGMITLKQDGYLKALEGTTSIEEVLRVAQD